MSGPNMREIIATTVRHRADRHKLAWGGADVIEYRGDIIVRRNGAELTRFRRAEFFLSPDYSVIELIDHRMKRREALFGDLG